MDIRPTQPGQTPKPGPGRTEKATPGSAAQREEKAPADPGAPAGDQVEFSEEARRLHAALGLEQVPVSELSPERLREVLQRIEQGHYDQPEAIEALTRRLADELRSRPAGE
jgi:hypothetical protein